MTEEQKAREARAVAHAIKETGNPLRREWSGCAEYESHLKGAEEEQAAMWPTDCETGCMVFDGGERRHHPNCRYYPGSLTKIHDDTRAERDALAEQVRVLRKAGLALLEEFEMESGFAGVYLDSADDFRKALRAAGEE